MELAYIREFLQLARTLNYSEAARQLYVSQSTLTRHMQMLERELGEELFQRSTRSVELTRFGARFVTFAERLVHTEDCMREVLNAEQRNLGTVIFDYDLDIPEQAAELLLRFRQEHPEIELQIWHSGDPTEALRGGRVSFAIISEGQLLSGEFCEEKLSARRLVAVMPADHPLAGRTQVTLQDLAPWPMVILQKDAGEQGPFQTAWRKVCLHAELYVMNSASSYAAVVLVNRDIAIVQEDSVPEKLASLACVVPIEPPIVMEKRLAYRRSPTLNQAEQIFRSFLLEHRDAF